MDTQEQLAKAAKAFATDYETDLATLDSTFDDMHFRRSRVLGKLESVIDNMDLNLNELSARDIEVRMNIINTYTSSLKDTETAIERRVGVKQKKKDSETNQNIGELVVSIVQKMRQTGQGVSDMTNASNIDDADALLARRTDIVFSDDEVREDAMDIS